MKMFTAPTTRRWRPSLGAWRDGQATHFRVWAPAKQRVEVVLETPDRVRTRWDLQKAADDTFHGVTTAVGAGDRYRYLLDGEGPYPDPASRYQPDGVHGPSAVIDAGSFPWTDTAWRGLGLGDLVIYELHAGTFTAAGTFSGAIERLPYLRDLGITAIELMPVGDFPGQRNWGYDGVALFAPARCYGYPDDLRRLVDSAHRIGLGVLLDVVYNHFGPDGAYHAVFSPYYFSTQHHTPWGAAINLDGPQSRPVRDFLIENALHWIHEYHLDGLRLDATHALVDAGPCHFLAELSSRVRASVHGRRVLLIAEDHRNLADMVQPEVDGGWGLDAVWADDFHHQMRRHLAGDHEGYYRDYTGSADDLATTIRQGWFYCGQQSAHLDAPRGTNPTGLRPRQFVVCLQNHDQVGNRALGERLNHQITPEAYRAATVLLLCVPETPLLFMGQEWAASTPFQYFTDHHAKLGHLVTEGRRQEFRHFAAFADAQARRHIPDPQDPTTFARSHLNWSEAADHAHAATLRLYKRLLQLRRIEPALQSATWDGCDVVAIGTDTIVVRRSAPPAHTLLIVVHLRGADAVTVERPAEGGAAWERVLSTEDPEFSAEPVAPDVDFRRPEPVLHFARPGAVILRRSTRSRR
jgi:maltooligosyltrehalose trehalohydrolase